MDIAPTLMSELRRHKISYDTVHHRHSSTSLHSAHAANIPANLLVKPVILEDENGFVMALVPANHYVKLHKLNELLDRNMQLATETDFRNLFTDCEIGAIPPIGEAYGIETVVDYSFDDYTDVYLEAGNHTDLIHLTGDNFRELMESAHHANISMH